jgi:excisionase family DNA binding protein
MISSKRHATIHATIRPHYQVHGIYRLPGTPPASRDFRVHRVARRSHLTDMTNHTIAAPITSWAELISTDREVLNRAEAACRLDVDARTINHAIEDGTIPAVRLGRRILIPRRPFMRAFGVETDAVDRPESA